MYIKMNNITNKLCLQKNELHKKINNNRAKVFFL